MDPRAGPVGAGPSGQRDYYDSTEVSCWLWLFPKACQTGEGAFAIVEYQKSKIDLDAGIQSIRKGRRDFMMAKAVNRGRRGEVVLFFVFFSDNILRNDRPGNTSYCTIHSYKMILAQTRSLKMYSTRMLCGHILHIDRIHGTVYDSQPNELYIVASNAIC